MRLLLFSNMRIAGISFFILLFCSTGLPAADSVALAGSHYDYHASSLQFAPIVDSAITIARDRLIKILGDSIHYRPQVYIEDNLQEFKRRIGTAVPDWGAAVAMPYKQMMVIKSPAHFRLGKSLFELVKHEYAHLALEDRLQHAKAPRWLDEGLAMYVAYEWGWSSNFALSQAVVLGSLVPLQDIEKLNRFPEGRAQTAYAQSYVAVKYLVDEYGFETFNILLDNLMNRQSMDDALMAAVGSNYKGFETEYLKYLKTRYNLLTIFIDMSYLWLFLALVVVIGFILRYRKRRKFYKEWDEYDKYHSTDFDYGDPDNPEQVDDEDKPWA